MKEVHFYQLNKKKFHSTLLLEFRLTCLPSVSFKEVKRDSTVLINRNMTKLYISDIKLILHLCKLSVVYYHRYEL